MPENKIARIPIASHGLHRHNYNYPWLSSINFGDVMPCYINTLRKGEKDSPKAGMYSQLMPIAHNAFATGRYQFKAIFVPYKFVWRPWYAFDQQTQYSSNGVVSNPTVYPFIQDSVLSDAFLKAFGDASGSSDSYDIISATLEDPNNTLTPHYWYIDANGRRVLRVLGALGCMPSFDMESSQTLNILGVMCYIKAFADYYFPNNYVGNSSYNVLLKFMDTDVIDFSDASMAADLMTALNICTINFYNNSIFDNAWDNPVTPNVNAGVPSVEINDVTISGNNSGGYTSQVSNSNSNNDDKTPRIIGKNVAGAASSISPVAQLSKYILDVLESVSLWAKRHQLAGARLLDRFLVSRGLTLGNDSAKISYLLGMRNVEIQVSGVENNTDVNLGELAGRGVASTGDSPLSFECKPEDDGIFLVLVSPLPDANFPILTDGFSIRKDYMDNYHAEYDKLAAAAVPSRVIQMNLNGVDNFNSLRHQNPFGFLNMYWDEIQERPRLLGDFILQSRGAEQLSAYHTFRLISNHSQRFHSYGFIQMNDSDQYQRLFYSDEQENLMLFLRWYGSQYKEKLPLGDSYDWDDDELNRKVSVVVGGSQK